MKRIFLFAGLLLSVVASASAVDYKNDYVTRFYEDPVWTANPGLSGDDSYQPVIYSQNNRAHIWFNDITNNKLIEYTENSGGTGMSKTREFTTGSETKAWGFGRDDAGNLVIAATRPLITQYSTTNIKGYYFIEKFFVYNESGTRTHTIDVSAMNSATHDDVFKKVYNDLDASGKADLFAKVEASPGVMRLFTVAGDLGSEKGGFIIGATSCPYIESKSGSAPNYSYTTKLRTNYKTLVIYVKNWTYQGYRVLEHPIGMMPSMWSPSWNTLEKNSSSWDNAMMWPVTAWDGKKLLRVNWRAFGYGTFDIDRLYQLKDDASVDPFDYTHSFVFADRITDPDTNTQSWTAADASVTGSGKQIDFSGHIVSFYNVRNSWNRTYSQAFTGIDCGFPDNPADADYVPRRYTYTNPANSTLDATANWSAVFNYIYPYIYKENDELRVIQFGPKLNPTNMPEFGIIRCFKTKLLPRSQVFLPATSLSIKEPVDNNNVVIDDVVYQGEKIDKKPSDAVYLVGAVTRGDSNSKLFPMYDVRGTGDYQGTFNIPSNLKFFYFVDKAGNRIAPATNVTRELSDGTKEERQEPVVIGGTGVFNVTNFNDGPVTFVYRKDTKMASFWPAAKKDCIYLVGKASGNLQPTSENSDQLKPYRLYDFTNDGVYEGTIQIGAGNFEFYLQHGLNGEAGSYTIGATDATAMTLVNDGASKGAIRTGKTPFAVSSWTEEKAVRFILDTRSAEWKLYAESGIGGAISVFGDMYVVVNGVPQKMTERIASRVYDCSLPAGNNTFYFKKNIGSTNGVTFNMGAPAPNTAISFDANKEASVGGVTAGTNTYRINESAPVMLTFDMVQGTLTAVSGDKRPEIVDLTLTANWAKPSSSLSGSDGYPRGGDVFARVFAYRPVLKDPTQSATSNVRLMAAGAGKIIAVADTIKNKNANNSVVFGGDKSLVRAKSYNVDVDTYYSWYDQITFKVPSTTTGNTDYPADPVRDLTVDFFPDGSGTGRWVAVIDFDRPDNDLPVSEYIIKDPEGNVIAVISGDAVLNGDGGDKTHGGPGTPWNAYTGDFVTSEQFTYSGDNPGDRGNYTVDVIYGQTNPNITQDKPATSTNNVKPTGVNKVITDEMGEAIVSLRAVAVNGAVVSDVKGADLDFNAFKNALAPGSYLIQVNGKKVIKVLVK